MKLIIFDIDQTLVDVLEFHNIAASKTFKEFFNKEAKLNEIDFTGKTMAANLVELARLKGIDETTVKEKIDRMLDFYAKAFMEAIPDDTNKYILPGVKELLEKIDKNQNFLAIVTGNDTKVANKILENTGLKKYFRIVVAGDQEEKRAELVKRAVEKAQAEIKQNFTEVIVIGDSILDIESAKPVGAKSIAVCTGYHTEEMLQAHHPDFLFPNLSDTERILKIIK